MLGRIREDMVSGTSIVITREAVVDSTPISKSSHICERVLGIDATQLNPYSICQPIRQGFMLVMNLKKIFTDSNTNKTRQKALKFGHFSFST